MQPWTATRVPTSSNARLRIGVTEVAAMTWLPTFVSAARAAYPRVTIEPEADAAVVPAEIQEPRFVCELVGKVEMDWMC